VQDEGVIDCPQIVWIGGDDMQVVLPRAEGNRDIDDIGVTGSAAQQADGAGGRVVQGTTSVRSSPSTAAIRTCRGPPHHA
jgi:acetoin utilization deacetylase AcuC-like enzyme